LRIVAEDYPVSGNPTTVQPEYAVADPGYRLAHPLTELTLLEQQRTTVSGQLSDHYVGHEDVLAHSLRHATTPEALASIKLTVPGMSPNAPDSGFGYISPSPDSGVGMRPLDLKSASVIPHG
jgi:mannose-1-phosphate guanylyltransferase